MKTPTRHKRHRAATVWCGTGDLVKPEKQGFRLISSVGSPRTARQFNEVGPEAPSNIRVYLELQGLDAVWSQSQLGVQTMAVGNLLYWALVFLVVAIVAGFLGFGGAAGAAAGAAHLVFYVAIVLLLISLVMNVVRR
jgi:uncharacterized membrane protein YtjA (UPF0391 family)